MDYAPILTAAGGGAVTWAGQSVVAFIKARQARAAHVAQVAAVSERHASKIDSEIEQHRDRLTFELLQAAREEVAAARRDATDLRNLQIRLRFFDEAIVHVKALLMVDESGIAMHHARAFLTRLGEYNESSPA